MIPVEYLWISLILAFGVIGAVRGLYKELGTSAVLMLSVFALWVGWDKAWKTIVSLFRWGPFKDICVEQIRAIYFSLSILFVAFIAYEGIVLLFPARLKGIFKNIFGFFGGLLNGYLVIGTVWNVAADAKYCWPDVTVVQPPFSHFHNTIVQYLPVSIMDSFSPLPFLFVGMLLLLAIIFT